MQISQDGIDLIKQEEGFRPDPYNDSAGHATIGYGTLLHKGNVTQADNDKFPNGISKAFAEILLVEHIKGVEDAINDAVKVPLTQNQFDALCSFTYNCGVQNLKNSTLLRVLNAGAYHDIPSQFRRWIFAGGRPSEGLKNRREREIAMWEAGAKAAHV